MIPARSKPCLPDVPPLKPGRDCALYYQTRPRVSIRNHGAPDQARQSRGCSVALGSQHKLTIVRCNPDAFKVAGRTIRTPKTERHPKLLRLLHSLIQEEPEKPFQRLFLFYDRAAEDSELPAVAEHWDVVARAVSRVVQ